MPKTVSSFQNKLAGKQVLTTVNATSSLPLYVVELCGSAIAVTITSGSVLLWVADWRIYVLVTFIILAHFMLFILSYKKAEH